MAYNAYTLQASLSEKVVDAYKLKASLSEKVIDGYDIQPKVLVSKLKEIQDKVPMLKKQDKVPMLYCLPKRHKTPL